MLLYHYFIIRNFVCDSRIIISCFKRIICRIYCSYLKLIINTFSFFSYFVDTLLYLMYHIYIYIFIIYNIHIYFGNKAQVQLWHTNSVIQYLISHLGLMNIFNEIIT